MQALLPSKKYFKLKNLFFFVFLFLTYFCLSHAGIKQEIYPFSVGFFIALIWCNKNIYYNIFLLCLTGFLVKFDFYYFLSLIVFSISLSFIFKFLKKKNKHINSYIFAIISLTLLLLFVPYYVYKSMPLINIIYTFLLAIIFYLSLNNCFKTVFSKGINIKLNLDEIICASFILICLGSGLSEINLLNISLLKPIGIVLIFLSAICCTTSAPLITAASLGIGYAFNLESLNYVSLLCIFALVSIIFKNNKYYLIIALVLTELLLGFYFNIYLGYSITQFLFVIVPLLLVLLLPEKLFISLKMFFNGSQNGVSSRSIIDRNKNNLSKRFLDISNAFFDIAVNFKNSLKPKLAKHEIVGVLEEELIKKVCLNCKYKDRCLTILKDHILTDIHNVIETGFQKEKVSILDVPSFLNSHCFNINLLISTTNNLLLSYQKFEQNTEEKNSGKLLLLEEFEAIEKMFLKLSKEVKENSNFDFNKEEQIAEELNYKNIHVKDVVLNFNNNKKIELSLIVHEKDIENSNFIKTLNTTLNTKLEIVNMQKSQVEKYYIVYLKECAKYSCIYGISGANKFGNQVSGDNFSCIKLENNKVLFAICDGMGNGERAKNHSEQTISLIENFYKAGFLQDNIIKIVNKLIALNCEDVFSALDIALINLENGETDFIKLGAQESFIKSSTNVETISGDSLPMGIIQNIKPYVYSRIITANDMVFMCSDGTIDCIGLENLTSILQQTTFKNPQALCDEIVNMAISNTNGKPKDDITALAFKFILN